MKHPSFTDQGVTYSSYTDRGRQAIRAIKYPIQVNATQIILVSMATLPHIITHHFA